MSAVKKIKREVLERLRDHVRAEPPNVIVIRPRPELVAWAERRGMNSQPILTWARRTLREWAADPHDSTRLRFEPLEPVGLMWGNYPNPIRMANDPEDPLGPIGAEPDREGEPEFVRRARRHYRARDRYDSSRQRSRKGLTKRFEQFEWLARRMFLGQSDKDIKEVAARGGLNVSQDAIRKGIDAAAAALNLKLRRRPKGRLPRR